MKHYRVNIFDERARNSAPKDVILVVEAGSLEEAAQKADERAEQYRCSFVVCEPFDNVEG